MWVNSVKMTRLLERTLYGGAPWYNRVSFAAAVRPVVRYDQDARDELEVKKRLYVCLDQNARLRQKLRSLGRQVGSDAHWRSLWRRAALRRSSASA